MRIYEVRTEKGFSQRMLGDAIGVTYQAISHYEKGRRALPIELAKKMGVVLGVDWWLLYEDE